MGDERGGSRRRQGSFALAVALLLPRFTSAAVAVDFASPVQQAIDPTQMTWTHTASGTQRYVLVGIANTGGTAINSVKYGNVAMTQLAQHNQRAGCQVTLFGIVDPPTGASTVVADMGVVNAVAGSVSFTGVDPSTPVGTVTQAGDNTGPTLATAVASAPGEIAADFVCTRYGIPVTAAGGQPELWNGVATATAADRVPVSVTGAASTAPGKPGLVMSWAMSSGDRWASVAVSLRPVGAAPPVDAATPSPDAAAIRPAGMDAGAQSPDSAGTGLKDGAAGSMDGTSGSVDAPAPGPGPGPAEDGSATAADSDDRADIDDPAWVALRVGCACHLGGALPAPDLPLFAASTALALLAFRRRRP